MPTSPANDAPGDQPAEQSQGQPGDEPLEAPVGEELPAEVSAQLESLRGDLARSEDRHRRALADLDNYRKRVARDGDRRAAGARDGLLLEWLDVLDSVERALWMEPGDAGLVSVLSQMEGILTRHGVRRIEALGAPFDPVQHEAIATQPRDGVPPRTVLEVARSGFDFADGTVLRPAQVVVSTPPASGGS